MNLRKKYSVFGLLVCLAVSATHSDASESTFKNHSVGTTFTIAAAGVALGIAGCYAFSWIKKYLYERLVNEIVDDVILACTPNSTLEKMPAQKKETMLRKKAQLITMRVRVLEQLDTDIVKNNPLGLSEPHREKLIKEIKLAQAAAKVADFIRSANPYEAEYDGTSSAEQIIQKRIVASIIASAKPQEEWAAADYAAVELRQQFKDAVLIKLKSKIPALIYNLFVNSPVLLDSLLVH